MVPCLPDRRPDRSCRFPRTSIPADPEVPPIPVGCGCLFLPIHGGVSARPRPLRRKPRGPGVLEAPRAADGRAHRLLWDLGWSPGPSCPCSQNLARFLPSGLHAANMPSPTSRQRSRGRRPLRAAAAARPAFRVGPSRQPGTRACCRRCQTGRWPHLSRRGEGRVRRQSCVRVQRTSARHADETRTRRASGSASSILTEKMAAGPAFCLFFPRRLTPAALRRTPKDRQNGGADLASGTEHDAAQSTSQAAISRNGEKAPHQQRRRTSRYQQCNLHRSDLAVLPSRPSWPRTPR